MDRFFTYLLILTIVAIYSVLLLVVYQHFFVDLKNPDAILSFEESDDKIKANFIMLLPPEEIIKKAEKHPPMIMVEVRNKNIQYNGNLYSEVNEDEQ